jgi:hypothetical protein
MKKSKHQCDAIYTTVVPENSRGLEDGELNHHQNTSLDWGESHFPIDALGDPDSCDPFFVV